MRRPLLYGTFFVLAAVLFTIPLIATPRVHTPLNQQASPNRISTAGEKHFKQLTVQNDMKATEMLSRAQIVRDLKSFLSVSPGKRPTLSNWVKQHPEIMRAEWSRGAKKQQTGTLSSELETMAKKPLSEAYSHIRRNKAYVSPTFTFDKESYYVIAVTSSSKESLIALVNADVIQSVERHQLRNLRLVPYPSEGRYRIESVLPNSTSDTTVRTGEDNGNASHYSVDEVVVKFRKTLTDRELLELRKTLGLTVVRHTREIYIFRSTKMKTEELMTYFRKHWNPEFVEPHYLYMTNELPSGQPIVPNDTLYSEYQWNLPEIATEYGWDLSKGSKDIVVAVIDTGVQADHPDLQGRLVEGVNIVDPSSPPDDDVGHGTHVAGIIAAEVNNNEGVAGMTWYTKIMPIKSLDSSGAGSTYSVAEGIIWAVDHGANIINMSLGNYAEADFLHDALKYAYDHGVLLVAASGNDNTDRPGYPAAYPEVLAVAATEPDESRAEYSNFGDYIDIAAPGSSIPSTYIGSRYAALSGTSMACPHVAALGSLVQAINPKLSNAEIMDILKHTAKDLGAVGKDNEFGFGQIDVTSALQAAGGQSQSLQLLPNQFRKELERLKVQ
ncbi:MAG: S8 family peptidase [Candidatus Cohnella colombiensis]|uniref:S8 family peptidase n=1 Tax=Candidatus Cohnella colombiensis TaxID=3121368 RepID=A0AA95JBM7_9BACL|nr:MAG: S8 family peptidase [Cohnella sp.]